MVSEETRARMSAGTKNRYKKAGEREKTGAARKKFIRDHPEIMRRASEKFRATINSDEYHQRIVERGVGGFWYGSVKYNNVKYPTKRTECELWRDVNLRVHSWFGYKCVLCGKSEKGRSFAGHHVFYDTRACCLMSEENGYYSNLNAPDHPMRDYYIGKNPNYFVILCPSCHGKTNGNFENRKHYADGFKELIDKYYDGKCYYTLDEFIEFGVLLQNKIESLF